MADVEEAKSPQSKFSYWRDHVESWRGSGLGQAEYSRQAGISLSKFGYWKRRFDRQPPSGESRAIVALPVPEFSAGSTVVQPLLLHFGSGFRVEIGGDFCPAVLEKLIVTLGRLS